MQGLDWREKQGRGGPEDYFLCCPFMSILYAIFCQAIEESKSVLPVVLSSWAACSDPMPSNCIFNDQGATSKKCRINLQERIGSVICIVLQLIIAPAIIVSQFLFPLLADLSVGIKSSSPIDALSWRTTTSITLSKHGCMLRWRRRRSIILGWLLLILGLLVLRLSLMVLGLWRDIRLGCLGLSKEFLAFILKTLYLAFQGVKC